MYKLAPIVLHVPPVFINYQKQWPQFAHTLLKICGALIIYNLKNI